ncbi:Nucleotide-binding alpha-beta plait [Neofusicoccum parvum]|uniref:Putative nucleotide-binding alpha-beta plait protein n=1 Tax=Botryosphaeria parva (strain UCR-NP2) TaxID=1287680 RepID=R1GFB1_BOTPV|nr:putative nucleotide-binding alpha-beta plait protein [Neofusicoccum parvum UCRNP2]GME65381.1 Nucleotide-binding alpha-beta plait [Neofusicoccum parvum]
MESNNVQPAAFAADALNADMDIDMDIDLTAADDIDAFDTEGITLDAQPAAFAPARATDPAPTAQEPQLEKVNVEGVDNLTTAQVKAYACEHYPSDQYVRIEWVDDSHANVVYETSEAALAALRSFIHPNLGDPLTLSGTLPMALVQREAKDFFANPDIKLKVRLAVVSDVKAPRAHEASRFYLMNPDKDPWEKRKRQQGDRRNGGDGYNRKRYDDREQRRRRDNEAYDVDMYDEEAGAARSQTGSRRGRRGSLSDDSMDDRRRGRGRGTRSKNLDDLLPSKSDGRLRDRSASPLRDGDGRYGFEEEDSTAHRRARRRSYSPPSNRGNATKELFPNRGGNTTKELFPNQGSRSTLLSSSASSPNPSTNSNTEKDLFPGKAQHTQKRSRELFPHKTSHSNHRRQDAFDSRDYTEEAINKPRSLEERITGGPNQNGRTNGRSNGDQGFSVKGSADAPGFSIRGAADVKELFPMKTGGGGSNAGKELFSEKIKGRGGPRRKAEDMFF